MKVKDLIKELLECDPEFEVILQEDPEGNGYSPCAGSEIAIWAHGEVHHPEERENEKPNCVVIWPVY